MTTFQGNRGGGAGVPGVPGVPGFPGAGGPGGGSPQILDLLKKAHAALSESRLDDAEHLCRQVLMMNPRNVNALHFLGVTCVKAGRLEQALQFFGQAIDIKPDEAMFRLNMGGLLMRMRRYAPAIEQFEQAALLNPQSVEAQTELGNCKRMTGDMEGAAAAYRKAVELRPDHPIVLNNHAALLMARGQYDEALESLTHAIAIDPENVMARANYIKCLHQLGRYPAALESVNAALEKWPNHPRLLNHSASVLMALNRQIEAVAQLHRALRVQPDSIETLLSLGYTLRATGRTPESEPVYQRAIKLAPREFRAHYGLAVALERLNRLDESRAAALRSLEINPQYLPPEVLLARLDRREDKFEDARARLEKVLSGRLPRGMAGSTNVELGHVLDKLGLYDEAFDRIRKGQWLRAQSYNIRERVLNLMPNIAKKAQDFCQSRQKVDWPDRIAGATDAAPIFFVGFPRSGTTLIEQVLGAHPNLATTDERPILANTIGRIPAIAGRPLVIPDELDQLTDEQVCELRKTYWTMARSMLPQGTLDGKRLVDKMPMNILNLPLIRRIFPEAKVLVALRDPRDCTLSCFMQKFLPNPGMVNFFTIKSTMKFYATVMGAWLSMRDVLGLAQHTFHYEDVVENPEPVVRGIFEFIGEPWDPSVLLYHEKTGKKFVSTPSYVGVSQPMYKKSRGRWRKYQAKLEPYLEPVMPFVRQFGYEE